MKLDMNLSKQTKRAMSFAHQSAIDTVSFNCSNLVQEMIDIVGIPRSGTVLEFKGQRSQGL